MRTNIVTLSRNLGTLLLVAGMVCFAGWASAQAQGTQPPRAGQSLINPPRSANAQDAAGTTQQQSLQQQGSVDTVVAALIEASKSEDQELRKSAFGGLSLFLDSRPELVTMFVEAAQAEEGPLRDSILYFFSKMDPPPREAMEVLIKHGLGSQQFGGNVRQCLAKYPEQTVPLLLAELKAGGADPERGVEIDVKYCVEIVELLSRMKADAAAAVSPMLEILADDNAPTELRAKVAMTVAQISQAQAEAVAVAAAAPERAREMATQMIQQLDLNADGKLSADEFPTRDGSDYFFRRMDRDGDGLLDMAEVMQAMASPNGMRG